MYYTAVNMVEGPSMQDWHHVWEGEEQKIGERNVEEGMWRTLTSGTVPANSSDEVPDCSVMDETTEGNGCYCNVFRGIADIGLSSWWRIPETSL